MKRLISILLTGIFILTIMPGYALAWGQPAHEAMNREAINQFKTQFGSSPKFKDAPIDETATYKGPAVSGSSGTEYNHKEVINPGRTFSEWVITGGFSADEPHGYSGVKHFYDPLALSGSHELTDQETSHGILYTAVDAITWAFNHQENPYNWQRALEYYKQSMEIPEDGSWTPASIPKVSFRDIDIPCSTTAEARNAYTGKAFRALGECMHMISDMTQPAHVRNDSHPVWESIEQSISAAHVTSYAASAVDSRVSYTGSLRDTFVNLATFTNANFYSQDTIYDSTSGIKPNNGEKPNPSPQFSTLKAMTDKSTGRNAYAGTFNGKDVPLVRQTYMSYKTGLYSAYEVPADYADGISEVLIPIAVKANVKIIHNFFPTLKLSILVEEDEDFDPGETYRQFELNSQLAHYVEDDPEWKEAGLQIYYSGPAELFRIRNGKEEKMANVTFKGGYLDQVQDPFSDEMVQGPLLLFLSKDEDEPRVELDVKATYNVEYEDSVFLRVKAGGRIMESNQFTFQKDPAEIKLVPDKYQAQPDNKVKITAEVKNSPKKPVFLWDFGDGTDEAETTKPEAEHIYEEEGDYDISVTLLDGKTDKELAEAEGTAEIKILDLAGTWNLTFNIEGSKAQELIGGMAEKMLVKIFGEGADQAVEYSSLKGESIYAQMILTPSDKANVFTGSLNFTGSTNPSAIDASGWPSYVECTLTDNKLAITTDSVEGFAFIMDGVMQNENYLNGNFKFGNSTTEVIHGNWEAKR